MATKTTNEKRSRTTLVRGWDWNLCKALPNVVTVASTADDSGMYVLKDQEFIDLLFNAARMFPTWTFKVTETNGFRMLFGTEYLGRVTREWVRRSGNHLIALHGDRVSASMSRRSTYNSPDAAAVLRKIKEYIYPKTDEEYIRPEVSNAFQTAYSAQSTAASALSQIRKSINDAAIEFALSVQGREAFMAYEARFGQSRDTAAALVNVDEAKRTQVAASQYQASTGGDFAVATRRDDYWLVQYKDKASRFGIDDLPDMYGNVGLLKMTNEKIPVAGVGMKVSEATFIIEVNEVTGE